MAAIGTLFLPAVPALAAQRPQRFLERGLHPSLQQEGRGAVRVRIALAGDPVGAAAAEPALNERLTGRLTRADQRLLRASPQAAGRIASRQERSRNHALAALAAPAARVRAAQLRLMRALERRGGRVVAADPLTNTLVAILPASRLEAIALRSDVRAVEPAQPLARLAAAGLGLSTEVAGAPLFWGAGFTGGTGAGDANPIDLAIAQDKIQQDHPAFAGVTFQTPPGRGPTSNSDHGPAVASIAISRGAAGCSKCVPDDAERKGIAPGLDSVLDADPASGDPYVWALGITQTLNPDGDVLTGAGDPAEVINNSGGTGATVDDDIGLQNTDAYAASLGTTMVFPAGNTGAPGSVHDPCIAYNSLCMGAYDYWGTADPSDDRMASFSSLGPSPAGRKKPDLVAVGITQYAERRWADPLKGLWSWDQEGTSWASPQGAGAAALLAGSGISDPSLQKAILINSARSGRSAPDQPIGTQTGWQPDWGWGALNLEAALTERTNGAAATVPGGSARFFRATGVTAADRATLVWHRRVTADCLAGNCIPQAMTLTNLDLQQLDPATGAVQAQSNSTKDNVEQVRSPGGPATAIYKVKATSSVDALPAEPFALAARRPVTPLASPRPAVTIAVADGAQRPGATTTVTATVRNPSPDLTGENAGVSLQLPAGVDLIEGAQTRPLGTLATSSAAQTFSWRVKGTSDGLKKILAVAQADRFGETFTASAGADYVVDGSGPSPSIAAPQGTTGARSIAIAWGASDAHSGIAHYDVESSADGGAWSAWLTGTTQTQGAHDGSPGHRYRFRVRATDSLGNVSAWVESSDVAIADPPANPPTLTPPIPVLKPPALALAAVRRTRAGIAVSGRIDSAATGPVRLVYATKAGRRIYKSRAVTAAPRRGRLTAKIRLPSAARKARRGTLEMRYSGDAGFAAQTLRRTVVAR